MNIFDMAMEVTQKQNGDIKDFVSNALKIRRYIDKNPKKVYYIFNEDKITEEERKYISPYQIKRRRRK